MPQNQARVRPTTDEHFSSDSASPSNSGRSGEVATREDCAWEAVEEAASNAPGLIATTGTLGLGRRTMTGRLRYWALVAIVALTAGPGAVRGDVKPEDVKFLPNVEKIMRNKGMKKAAALQHYWFKGEENQLVGKRENGKGTKKPLSISDETITMDWVLEFGRARDQYEELVEAVANDAAKKELAEQLQKKFKKSKKETIAFGDFSAKGHKLYAQHTNSRPVTYKLDQLQDELQFALGAFTLYIIPKGKATLTRQGIDVTISEVGVFVFDSYDFNGDQDLRWWKMPDKVSLVHPFPVPDYVNVTNEHYREYRKRNKRGGDFLIYTDVKVSKAKHKFTLPAGAAEKEDKNKRKGKDKNKPKDEK